MYLQQPEPKTPIFVPSTLSNDIEGVAENGASVCAGRSEGETSPLKKSSNPSIQIP
jgi:hypothetical protein